MGEKKKYRLLSNIIWVGRNCKRTERCVDLLWRRFLSKELRLA